MQTFLIYDKKTGEVIHTHVSEGSNGCPVLQEDVFRTVPKGYDRKHLDMIEVGPISPREYYHLDINTRKLTQVDPSKGKKIPCVLVFTKPQTRTVYASDEYNKIVEYFFQPYYLPKWVTFRAPNQDYPYNLESSFSVCSGQSLSGYGKLINGSLYEGYFLLIIFAIPPIFRCSVTIWDKTGGPYLGNFSWDATGALNDSSTDPYQWYATLTSTLASTDKNFIQVTLRPTTL